MSIEQAITKSKGGGLQSAFLACEQHMSSERFAEFLAMLPTDLRKAYESKTLIATKWYPLEWERRIVHSVVKLEGNGVEQAEQHGYRAAMVSFKGIYRIFFKLLKPETLLRKGASIYSQFYDLGNHEPLETRNGFARSRFTCPGFDEYLWQATAGACRAALEICGASAVVTRFTTGGREGDVTSELTATWH